MTNRTCTIDGCDKTHRARGLCSTHYNRARYTEDARHPKVRVPCSICGTIVSRGSTGQRRPTCSVECRTILQHASSRSLPAYDWAIAAMSRARVSGCQVIEYVARAYILERDAHRCYLCDIDTSLAASPFDPASATVDHVIPLSKGGPHTADNLRTCCLSCNSSKGDLLAA